MCERCVSVEEKIAHAIEDERASVLEAHWKAFDKRTQKLEDEWTDELVKLFEGQRKDILATLKKKTIKTAQDVFDWDTGTWNASIEEALEPYYVRTVIAGGEAALQQVAVGISFDVVSQTAVDFIANKLDKIVDINQTTIDSLHSVISTGIENGDSINMIANSIEDVFDDALGYRARIIARTEVIGSSNFGAIEGYRQSGVVGKKEWVTQLDGRQRKDHELANVQTVPLDKPFIVGGELLEYPGDPAGSGGNVINCRCTIIGLVDPDLV